MLHRMMSSHKWDNYALTVHFNQIVDKPLKPLPIPDDWNIFVAIASYRDSELLRTIKHMVDQATYPERLRIVVYNQVNFYDRNDLFQIAELNDYVDNLEEKKQKPSILIENTSYE